jgi:hypothetical protein
VPGLLAILVLLSLAFAASAHAAPPVENQNDSGQGSLREAILMANPGDTIEVPPGDYRLTSGQLRIDTDLLLRGTGGAGVTTIQSMGNFRVLCITGGIDVTLDGLTIHGGRASPGGNDCPDGHGGGISSTANSLSVTNSWIQHNTAAPNVSGGGGGIHATGDLIVRDSIVRHNSATALAPLGNNGGGGIYWAGSGFPNFEVIDSTVYENTTTVAGAQSGGGGIWSNGQPTLENVTLSGNRHSVSGTSGGGGGGIFVLDGPTPAGSIEHVTFSGNHSDRSGGAIARGPSGATPSLANSVLAGNSALTDGDCSPGAVTSAGGNVSSTAGSTCGFGSQDLAGVDPQLGPLAVNGSDNGTLTHELLSRQSPAVEFGENCTVGQDQRGVSRTQFGANCDSGAYEFDGKTNAAIPDCSPTGVIPLTLDEPPGGDVDKLLYRVSGGPQLENDLTDVGEPPTPSSVTIPEGRNTLEYWGQWTNGVQQGHGFQNVLVDKTRPAVDVQSAQGQSIYVITRRASVNIQAADGLSGLVQNPTASGVPISTGTRGTASVSRTAADLCQNQATDSFDYRVLAPGLGIRTVLERVRGTIRVRSAGGGAGAQASQKGRSFAPLTQPRELPVRSFIDARQGTARLTTARTRREDQIQDGLFSAGLFQVLQSRRVRSRGLTEARLKGGNFGRCPQTPKGGPSAAARRVIRRLSGNARGRFRTRGRHSAATVRGTVWEVIDRCDGTLTKVKRGRVAVRDFRRKRTVIVRAGKSYLARAPG